MLWEPLQVLGWTCRGFLIEAKLCWIILVRIVVMVLIEIFNIVYKVMNERNLV